MASRTRRIRDLEFCDASVFGDVFVTKQLLPMKNPRVRSAVWTRIRKPPPIKNNDSDSDKRRASILLDQLLLEIYANYNTGYSDYNSATSSRSHKAHKTNMGHLQVKGSDELRSLIGDLESHVVRSGSVLVRQLKRRDALRRQRDARCDVTSYLLRKRVPEFSPEMRFSIEPLPGDSGFSQWHSAMKMVSQLPEGIPLEFRRRLWLSLADKHLFAKGIDWSKVERNCFSEWSHPADAELGVQIVKDLHRTGCSLFCGKDGQENQALLKRVLLAYARWNKAVGYCQGFNMLAALILQVTEKCEADALKLMIYLIEGVLPDSYFADSLRGLSIDMAVFRELLRTKLPRLSRHLDTLQVASKEGTTSYEPPLTNVFTMQWFLTLFCNCLPQPTVLRVWDLILLEGNEILLRTSLAIWQVLADRIMAVKSADEFYCVMGVLMREILEYDLIDANTLIKGIVAIGPLTELNNLRDHYLYNINPWGSAIPPTDPDRRMKVYHKDRLVLDIGVLKKQYTKLKQRQRQAHIIFNTAVARQTSRPAPVAMNHLLLGKSALVPAKRIGPPKGAIPPARQQPQQLPPPPQPPQPPHPLQPPQPPQPPKTLHWKDTRRGSSSSSSSSDTELCDDPDDPPSDGDEAKCQLPDDNLNKQSDINLMIEDNTEINISASVNESAKDISPDLLDFEAPPAPKDSPSISQDLIDDNQIANKSDIFDTDNGSSDIYDLNKLNIERSDSIASEDGFDFEKFLEERVKSFKEKKFSSEESIDETSEQERIKYARKNSERALEIIQENSLILHRILQCQSRLTPTPPPDDKELSLGEFVIPSAELGFIADDDTTPTNEFPELLEPSISYDEHFPCGFTQFTESSDMYHSPDKAVQTNIDLTASLSQDNIRKQADTVDMHDSFQDERIKYDNEGCLKVMKCDNEKEILANNQNDTLITTKATNLDDMISKYNLASKELVDNIVEAQNSTDVEFNDATMPTESARSTSLDNIICKYNLVSKQTVETASTDCSVHKISGLEDITGNVLKESTKSTWSEDKTTTTNLAAEEIIIVDHVSKDSPMQQFHYIKDYSDSHMAESTRSASFDEIMSKYSLSSKKSLNDKNYDTSESRADVEDNSDTRNKSDITTPLVMSSKEILNTEKNLFHDVGMEINADGSKESSKYCSVRELSEMEDNATIKSKESTKTKSFEDTTSNYNLASKDNANVDNYLEDISTLDKADAIEKNKTTDSISLEAEISKYDFASKEITNVEYWPTDISTQQKVKEDIADLIIKKISGDSSEGTECKFNLNLKEIANVENGFKDNSTQYKAFIADNSNAVINKPVKGASFEELMSKYNQEDNTKKYQASKDIENTSVQNKTDIEDKANTPTDSAKVTSLDGKIDTYITASNEIMNFERNMVKTEGNSNMIKRKSTKPKAVVDVIGKQYTKSASFEDIMSKYNLAPNETIKSQKCLNDISNTDVIVKQSTKNKSLVNVIGKESVKSSSFEDIMSKYNLAPMQTVNVEKCPDDIPTQIQPKVENISGMMYESTKTAPLDKAANNCSIASNKIANVDNSSKDSFIYDAGIQTHSDDMQTLHTHTPLDDEDMNTFKLPAKEITNVEDRSDADIQKHADISMNETNKRTSDDDAFSEYQFVSKEITNIDSGLKDKSVYDTDINQNADRTTKLDGDGMSQYNVTSKDTTYVDNRSKYSSLYDTDMEKGKDVKTTKLDNDTMNQYKVASKETTYPENSSTYSLLYSTDTEKIKDLKTTKLDNDAMNQYEVASKETTYSENSSKYSSLYETDMEKSKDAKTAKLDDDAMNQYEVASKETMHLENSSKYSSLYDTDMEKGKDVKTTKLDDDAMNQYEVASKETTYPENSSKYSSLYSTDMEKSKDLKTAEHNKCELLDANAMTQYNFASETIPNVEYISKDSLLHETDLQMGADIAKNKSTKLASLDDIGSKYNYVATKDNIENIPEDMSTSDVKESYVVSTSSELPEPNNAVGYTKDYTRFIDYKIPDKSTQNKYDLSDTSHWDNFGMKFDVDEKCSRGDLKTTYDNVGSAESCLQDKYATKYDDKVETMNIQDNFDTSLTTSVTSRMQDNSGIISAGSQDNSGTAVTVSSQDIATPRSTSIDDIISKYHMFSKEINVENEERLLEGVSDVNADTIIMEFAGNNSLIDVVHSKEVVGSRNLVQIVNVEDSYIREVDYNLEKYRHKLGSPLIEEQSKDDKEELIEIDKNSKYNSILEYSRNLDEKFNNLILKASGPKINPKLTLEAPDAAKSLPSHAECNSRKVNTPQSHFEDKSLPEDRLGLDLLKSPEDPPTDGRKSPKSPLGSPNTRSPNRGYSPFPVNKSSRQNKDVAVRLGLYKK